MQAYRVYYDEGKFIPFEPVKIKKGSRAIVTILDDSPIEEVQEFDSLNDVSRRQIEAMRRFREEVRNDAEPVPEFERIALREIKV